jgi:hypothetical protein
MFVTKLSPHNFVILQGYRYLELPILGVQRRFRVNRQHPNSQPSHTSTKVEQFAELCPKSHHHFAVVWCDYTREKNCKTCKDIIAYVLDIYTHTHTHTHTHHETNHDLMLNTRPHTSTHVCSYLDITGLTRFWPSTESTYCVVFHKIVEFFTFSGLFPTG